MASRPARRHSLLRNFPFRAEKIAASMKTPRAGWNTGFHSLNQDSNRNESPAVAFCATPATSHASAKRMKTKSAINSLSRKLKPAPSEAVADPCGAPAAPGSG